MGREGGGEGVVCVALDSKNIAKHRFFQINTVFSIPHYCTAQIFLMCSSDDVNCFAFKQENLHLSFLQVHMD